MKIGFIGVGRITTAVVDGFCKGNDRSEQIYLHDIRKEKPEKLASKYQNVQVMNSNQEIVDNCDWVILALIPKVGKQVVESLRFNNNNKVISFMTDTKLEDLKRWIKVDIPVNQVIPMPSNSERVGPIVVYPQSEDVANLFSKLGSIVQINQESQTKVLLAITALMGSYYTMLSKVTEWGTEYKLTKDETAKYTTSLFEALSVLAYNQKDGNIEELANDMTPGGLNELAREYIQKSNGLDLWIEALREVMKRLEKN